MEINVARFARKNETFLVGFKQCGSCFMLVNMDRLGNGKEEKKSDEDYCHRGLRNLVRWLLLYNNNLVMMMRSSQSGM